MRHRKSFNHLGRTSAHRKAMLSNMASSLILHKRINTTVAKAKALRTYVEPLITKAKDDTTHSRRVVFSYLQNKFAVTELFREVSAKVGDRPGGYTRVIKLGKRLGDSAEMAMIELVDFNEHLLAEKATKKKTSRRRRGGKKKTTAAAAEAPAAKVEAPVAKEAATEEKTPASEAEIKDAPEAKAEETPKAEAKKEEKVEEKKEAKAEVKPAEEKTKKKEEKADSKDEAEKKEE